jgi:hypothetical protein
MDRVDEKDQPDREGGLRLNGVDLSQGGNSRSNRYLIAMKFPIVREMKIELATPATYEGRPRRPWILPTQLTG